MPFSNEYWPVSRKSWGEQINQTRRAAMARKNRDHKNTNREAKGNDGNTEANDRGETRVRNDDDMHDEFGAFGKDGKAGNSVVSGGSGVGGTTAGTPGE